MCIYINITHIYSCVDNSIHLDTIFMEIWVYNLSLSVYTHIWYYPWFRTPTRSWNIIPTDRQTTIYMPFTHIVYIVVTYIVYAVFLTDPYIYVVCLGKKSWLHPGRQWAVLFLGGQWVSQTRDSTHQKTVSLLQCWAEDVHLVTQVSIFVSCQKTSSLMWISIIWSLFADGFFKNSENYCSIPRFQYFL